MVDIFYQLLVVDEQTRIREYCNLNKLKYKVRQDIFERLQNTNNKNTHNKQQKQQQRELLQHHQQQQRRKRYSHTINNTISQKQTTHTKNPNKA